MSARFTILLLLILLAGGSALAGAPGDGFIHGTVTWPSGETATGFIRWEDEEAFWDDHFQSGYRQNPWLEHIDAEALRAQRRKEYYESHGLLDRLIYSLENRDEDPVGWRMFMIRFGDLVRIEINDGEDDFAVTADGSRHEIGGFANDAGSDLLIYTGQDEPTEVDWNDLASIEFSAAPPEAVPYGERLYGVVETQEGQYEGFIQWDLSECVSIDILDGRLDGKSKDIPVGDVRSLARAEKQNASTIVMKDGTSLTLGGSNDLDSGNRGIMVENPDWGRVTLPWSRFRQVTFMDGKGSGPGRDSYANAGPLMGSVTLKDGTTVSGRLVYDLDEGWRWDFFNGRQGDLVYNIPFPLIREITPLEQESCRVVLRSGQTLELDDNQDTGKENGGVLIFDGNQLPARHVLWPEIRTIRLDP